MQHDNPFARLGERASLLYELGCAFAARIELDELIPLVMAKCRDVLDAEGAAVLLLDHERNELYFPYVAEEDPQAAAALRQLRFPADRGIAGAVLQSGCSIRVDDAATDPRFYDGVDRQTHLTTRALLSVPLTGRRGPIGVVQVLNPNHGGSFSEEDLAFLEALAGSIAVAVENARLYAQLREQVSALERAVHEHNELLAIRRELDIARNIQQSILPRVFPPFPGRTDFEMFATMLPAREVGGDFYDFFLVDPERLAFVIGDVSGKGMPAALFMAVSRTLLKAVALTGAPPGDCLRRVNSLLCLDNSAEMFVTLFYGILSTRTGVVEYGNGGHNPPFILRRDGAVESLARTGDMVLGVMADIPYGAKQVALRAGDGIFLYTDGITEAMDASGTLFSEPRLRRLLSTVDGAAPEALIRQVVDEVQRYSAGAPQSDDITTLAIRYLG
jgi:serine phosphatase RsbU (regulator of sigma subunit)